MHRHLPTGHSVTIGYEFPDNHVGEVKIGFAFKSPKDQFSKAVAHTVTRKAIAEGGHVSLMQNNDIHIIDMVVDAFNETGRLLMPDSWKKAFPEGLFLYKRITLEPVSVSFKAAQAYADDNIKQATCIMQEVVCEKEILSEKRLPEPISLEATSK
jgi:hypothetical protein